MPGRDYWAISTYDLESAALIRDVEPSSIDSSRATSPSSEYGPVVGRSVATITDLPIGCSEEFGKLNDFDRIA